MPTNSSRESPNDPKTEALKAIQTLIQIMITLATATVVFGATFVGDIVKPSSLASSVKWYLYTSWISLGLSLVFGLVAHGRLTQNLIEGRHDPDETGLEWTVRVQQLGLVAGLVLFALFAIFQLPG